MVWSLHMYTVPAILAAPIPFSGVPLSALLKCRHVASLAAILVLAGSAGAQTPAFRYPSPEVGSLAPDFTLPAATRYGILRDSIKLSNYRGKTVVLAFFFKARTKG